MTDFISMLEELCQLPGPTGFDSAVRDRIEELAKPYADTIRRMPLGGLLCFKKGKQSGRTVMFDAHIDEVGFIITSIRDDGTCTFGTLGGVNCRVSITRRVLCNGVRGLICGKPIRETPNEERLDPGGIDKLYIDFGFDSAEETKKIVSVGDPVTFDSEFVRFGSKRIKAKALDDRAGCALLLEMMQKELPFDTWFSFSTFEETGGGAGASTATFAVRPEFAVAVEATTAADVGGVPEENQVCRQQKGAVLSFMDHGTIYPPDLYHAALKLAADKGIPAQPKQAVAGGNNAGPIHRTAEGVRVLAVSLPCRYIHSGSCVLHEDDLRSAADLLLALDEMLGQGCGNGCSR